MSDIDPNEIKLGDLFWAKVGNHPWWPCMVFYDPSGEEYSQDNKRFHVQFLGPVQERAWISANYLIPYQGRENLDKYLKEIVTNSKAKLPKNKYELKVRDTIKEQWDESWKAADVVSKLSNQDRATKYGRLSDEAKRRIISEDQKDDLKKIMNNIPLTQDEEDEAFNYFVNEEIDLTPVDGNFNSESLIVELKNQWKIMNISNKRKFLVNPLNMFRIKPTKSRNSIAPSKPIKSTAGPKKSMKQAKPEVNYNLEIHRLIVSPAQYRNQPVCQQCEVYSPLPNQMLQCNGKCRQWYHPSCAKYKSLPSFDIHKPETFLCPDCVSGDYKCSTCHKSKGEDDPLYGCQYDNCSKQFHKKCISQDVCAKVSSIGSNIVIERCSSHVCNTCYRESYHPEYRHCLKEETSTRKPDAKGGLLTLSEEDHCIKKTEFLQCVRCPAVFHSGDLCTPAGSIELSLSHIVCPRHFSKTLSTDTTSYKTINMPFCSYCLKGGGERINCQWCPISYHTNCLKLSDPDLKKNKIEDASLTCSRCLFWCEPRYSQLVWAKVSGFRWWPVEVIHPRNAPINILQMSHPEGAFPIHFPASGEYQWTSRARVYPFELGLLFKPNVQILKTSTVEKAFAKALSVVPGIHSLYVNHVWDRGLPIYSITVSELSKEELVVPSNLIDDMGPTRHPSGKVSPSKPSQPNSRHSSAKSSPSKASQPSYETILTNSASSKAKEQDLTEIRKEFLARISKCSCKVDKSSGIAQCQIMGDSACENASKLRECISNLNCISEKDCSNRQFQLLTDKKIPLSVFKTTNRGYGLKSLSKIEMNSLVLEFLGEIITIPECNQRLSQAVNHEKSLLKGNERQPNYEDSRGDSMFVKLTSSLMIDFTTKGNVSRFINHSCEANLYAETWIVDGHPRLGLFADREIFPGEEITLNYMEISMTTARMMCAKGGLVMCLCGGDLCVNNIKANLACLTSSVQSNIQSTSSTHPPHLQESQQVQFKASPEEENVKPKITENLNCSPSSANKALSAQRKQDTNNTGMLKIHPNPVETAQLEENYQSKEADEDSDKEHAVVEKRPGNDLLDKWNISNSIRCHEDFCYRCGDGGELMLCDKTGCFKSFHLTCLGLSGPPRGIWYCPWHYCDVCGHPSTKMCWKCPNSFCDDHFNQIRSDGLPRITIDPIDRNRFKMAHDFLALKLAKENNEKEALSTKEDSERCISLACRWICSNHQVSASQSISHPTKPTKDVPLSLQTQSGRKRQLNEESDGPVEGSENKRQRTLTTVH